MTFCAPIIMGVNLTLGFLNCFLRFRETGCPTGLDRPSVPPVGERPDEEMESFLVTETLECLLELRVIVSRLLLLICRTCGGM